MLRRRVGRPGLVGTMARTAAVAGTATAVAGKVSQHQQAKAQQQAAEQQQAYQQQAAEQQPYEQQPQQQPAPAADPVERLRELAELKQQGIITDAEFAAMKAKLINA